MRPREQTASTGSGQSMPKDGGDRLRVTADSSSGAKTPAQPLWHSTSQQAVRCGASDGRSSSERAVTTGSPASGRATTVTVTSAGR